MREISLKISDIDCAACVERLTRTLCAVTGVTDAAVNYASGRALIGYNEEITNIARIAAVVKKAGFDVPADSVELKCQGLDEKTAAQALALLRALEEVQSAEPNEEANNIIVRVWPVNFDSRFLLAAVRDAGGQAELGEMTSGEEASDTKKRLSLLRLIAAATLLSVPLIWEMHYLIQFVLATLIQLWPGMYFYRGALRGLRNRTLNMDLLVALSTTIIYLYSSYVAFNVPIGKMLYFLSDGVLIALLLFGRYLEQLAIGESSQAIRRLLRLQPRTALVLRGGEERELSVEEIEEHDIVIIRPGERIPVDGIILEGYCSVDESLLTGESLPVDKAEGDELLCGTLNRSGSVKLAATRLGKDSALRQIIDAVQRAQSSKAPVQRLADKIAEVFVPAIIALAAAIFCLWFFALAPGDWSKAINCLCSMLVIACPCALGLATPTAIMVGTGRAAELGILFRSGAAIENCWRTDVVVLDKTGTLTWGQPEVTELLTCESVSPQELAISAAAVERLSQHPIAQAINRSAAFTCAGQLPPEVTGFENMPGYGVTGKIGRESIAVGSRELMAQLNVDISGLAELPDIRSRARTEVCTARDGRLLGVLGVADKLRPEAADCIARLKKMGKKLWLITGDNEQTAKAIAAECGIEHVLSGVLPEDKAKKIRELQACGGKLAMVGDGINDTPAMAAADIAIAMGRGADIAIDSSDITLLSGRLTAVPDALEISKAVMGAIKVNLGWALLYNVLSVTAAACGAVNPSMAAAAMSLSSIAVLMNSLRLRKAVGG